MVNYRHEVNNLKRYITTLKGQRTAYINMLDKDTALLAQEKELSEKVSSALAVAQIVAEQTQTKLEFHISNLVSMALAAVWDNPYTFQLRFTKRRDKTECDLVFIKNGKETDDVLGSAGGGVGDVASFALRLAVWSLNRSRNVQILDEPFKYVSLDLQERCSAMLKKLSKELGIQIIMVSHLPNLIGSADKVFSVELKDGISIVKEGGGNG